MFLLNLDKEDWLHPSHFWLCLLFLQWFVSPKQGLPYILTRAISTKRSFSCNVWTTGFQTQSSCLLKANLPGSLVCKMHRTWKDFWLGQGGAFVRSPLLSPCPPRQPFSPLPVLLSPRALQNRVWFALLFLIFLITEFILKQPPLSHLKQALPGVFQCLLTDSIAAHSEPRSPQPGATMATCSCVQGWQRAQHPFLK